MIAEAQHKLRRAARQTALGAAGTIVLAVGIAFLTAAAWIGLSLVADAFTAALVVGGVYTGVGLIILAFAARKPKDHAKHHAQEKPPVSGAEVFAGMGMAFIQGLDAGRATRNGFDRGRND